MAKPVFWRTIVWIFVLGFAAASFLGYYFRTPLRPGADATYPLGWYGWSDQGAYIREARAMAEGRMDAYVPEIRDGKVIVGAIYYYPLGYPFLGSLFLRYLPKDPFLVPDLIAYLFVVGCVFQVGLVRFGTIGAVAAVLALVASPFTVLTVIPWTSTPGAAATAFVAYLGLGRSRLGWVLPSLGGILLALTFASRGGGELVLLAPVLLGVFWKFRRENHISRKVIVMSLVFLVLAAIDLIVTARIFGTLVQPYFREVAGSVGFDFRKMPGALWRTLVFPGPDGGGWHSLLRSAPWFALAIIGFGARMRRNRRTSVDLGLLAGFLLSLLVVGSFNAFDAGGLRYYCLHYLKMWFPILSLYSVAGVLALKPTRDILSALRHRVNLAERGV